MGLTKKLSKRSGGDGSAGRSRRDELELEREIGLVCKHFGLDAEYCYDEILPDRWFAYLSVSLDMEEQSDYRAYVSAGGDPKKFKWASSDHAGTQGSDGDVGESILKQVGRKGFSAAKRDIWEYGQAVGLKSVTRADKWVEKRDGSYEMVGQVWVDENGNEVDVSGYQVVETKHEDALKFREMVYERLRR